MTNPLQIVKGQGVSSTQINLERIDLSQNKGDLGRVSYYMTFLN